MECDSEVCVWCSSDYLGMGQNRQVTEAMQAALKPEDTLVFSDANNYASPTSRMGHGAVRRRPQRTMVSTSWTRRRAYSWSTGNAKTTW